MRLYAFVNYYMSQLQHGLQTAHCVSEMSLIYQRDRADGAMYMEWAEFHKTIIICNGGNSLALRDLHNLLMAFGNAFNLPVVKFHEDEQSLNGALTSVAIIVPEKFYDVKYISAADRIYQGDPNLNYKDSYEYIDADGNSIVYWSDSDEFAFIKLLKSFRLA